MTNEYGIGRIITYANSSGSALAAGAVVAVGDRIAVVVAGIADGASGAVLLAGEVTIAKNTSTEMAQGADVFWDVAEAELVATADAGANPYAGKISVAAAEADATAVVRLGDGPVRSAAVADLDQTITDPPTQAEVQALSDKVDALLAALRNAGVVAD